MQFRFTYTIDDLREACAAVGKKGKPKKASGLFGWIPFLVMAVILFFILLQQPRSAASTPLVDTLPPATDSLILLTPNITVATFLLGFLTMASTLTLLNRRKTATPRQQHIRSKVAGIFFAVLVASLMLLNLYAFNPAHEVIDWHPYPNTELLASYVPWLIFFICAVVFIVILTRTRVRAQWMKQKSFQRPKEMEFDGDKFTIRDDATERHIRWTKLLRYRETANLLIVHNEDGQVYFLPKRALETPEQLMQLRGVIHTNIAEGEFLPQQSAFPVSTPRAVLPVTELPK